VLPDDTRKRLGVCEIRRARFEVGMALSNYRYLDRASKEREYARSEAGSASKIKLERRKQVSKEMNFSHIGKN
jgi:hypothetical protein